MFFEKFREILPTTEDNSIHICTHPITICSDYADKLKVLHSEFKILNDLVETRLFHYLVIREVRLPSV